MKVVSPDELPHRVRAVENLWIPMADGTRLAARMWIPESAEERPVPAVFEYIPYRKRDLSRQRDSIHGPYLAGHGYAFLRIDIRGCGDSEGHILDEYTEVEIDDGVRIVEWLAEQPWCDGRVGLMGISWGGFNALQIAARRPPALGAIVSACSTDDTYRDNLHFMGGALLGDNLSEATTMFAFQTLPPDPAVVGDRWREMWHERLEHGDPWLKPWLEHQHRDDFYRSTSVCEDYGAIQVPVMAVSGWADAFSNAVFRLMEHLEVPRMGLIGPWSHTYPHLGVPGPAIGFLQEVRRWFDHWLRGEETGVEREPRLRVWMQDSVPPQFSVYAERPGRWIAADEWPAASVEDRPWQLTRRRLLPPEAVHDETPDEVSVRSPLTVGLSAGKWCSYVTTPDLPGDQREDDGGSLVFDSVRLNEPLEILGEPVAELVVSADAPVAQIAVRLSDRLPDDRVTRVTYGVLNLTHREGSTQPRPLEPGEKVRVRVPLNAVAQRFPRGHRLRLSVSSSYWPLIWPSPTHARVTVYPHESHLHLPVRAPRSGEGTVELPPPEGCAPGERVVVRPGEVNWHIVRNLATNVSELQVVRHDGHFRIPEIDLEVIQRTFEEYGSRADDYGSIRGETRTERGFSRGDWTTRVETRTVLTSTPQAFRMHATLDAYEGDQRVFGRTWDHDIERR
ncbi:MAG: peptidase S15 [Sandaracinus sp.]|nr:peptidase S15 [Sandaracinus sp.]